MNILGIIACDVGGHPSACLIRDGKLVAFVEEERFVRVKAAPGYFPSQSVRHCLEAGGVKPNEISQIAFGWDANKYTFDFPLFLARSFVTSKLRTGRRVARPSLPGRPRLGSAVSSGLKSLLSFQPAVLTEKIVLGLRDAGWGPAPIPPITFVKHHLAHAASAFYCSGFEESAVLIFDGHGEENTCSIFRGEGRTLKLLKEINIPHSLGWFYSAFTEFLGWNPNEGEVKMMGLAPFGEPDAEVEALMAEVLALTDDGVHIDTDFLFYGQRSYGRFFSDVMVDRLGQPRGPRDEITQRHRNIARAAQARLEQAGIHLARMALKLAGSRNLCLAGGVALNCKMNGEIHKAGVAERFFVQPIAYDAGVSLGAAQVLAMEKGEDCRFEMDHLYWGPSFTNEEIELSLRESHLRYRRVEDVALETARLVANGHIVGWFQGSMECGPRALGGRSILADPRDPGMKDKVNDRIKFREAWRPFALSIQEERFPDYVRRPAASPFMIMAFDVVETKEPDIQSAMHWIDKTTRPQTVSRKTHPRYWDMLERFRELTGVPGVLNTSFNVKDEPIVCTPRDAIRCFYGCGMDALAIGDFLLEK